LLFFKLNFVTFKLILEVKYALVLENQFYTTLIQNQAYVIYYVIYKFVALRPA